MLNSLSTVALWRWLKTTPALSLSQQKPNGERAALKQNPQTKSVGKIQQKAQPVQEPCGGTVYNRKKRAVAMTCAKKGGEPKLAA